MAVRDQLRDERHFQPPGWLSELVLPLLIPLAVALLGAGLLWNHWHAWRNVRDTDLEPREHAFQRRRFRRRMQTSGLLAALGPAMAVGLFIAPARHPSLFVWYWLAVSLVVLWMMALAITDMIATRLHFGQQAHLARVERARLLAEAARLRKEHADQQDP